MFVLFFLVGVGLVVVPELFPPVLGFDIGLSFPVIVIVLLPVIVLLS